VVAAKAAAGWCCQRCGRPEDRGDPATKLTVHLREELAGVHESATLADVDVWCASCHGSNDAPRAAGGPADLYGDRPSRPAPTFRDFPTALVAAGDNR